MCCAAGYPLDEFGVPCADSKYTTDCERRHRQNDSSTAFDNFVASQPIVFVPAVATDGCVLVYRVTRASVTAAEYATLRQLMFCIR